MKAIFTFIICISLVQNLLSQSTVTMEDFKILDNTSWSGNLMYRNYGDNKKVTLRVTMQIKLKNNEILMSTQYTDEPSANSSGTVKLKKQGTYFGDEKVIKKTKIEDGTIKIITMLEGKDDNKAATIYKTYIFNSQKFIVEKEVQFKNSEKKIIRNKYSYIKV